MVARYFALGLLLVVHGSGAQTLPPAPAAPLPVIIDTDVGSDLDDAYAIAIAIRAEQLGYVSIRAITTSNMVDKAPAFVQALLAGGGRHLSRIPIGAFHGTNFCSGEGDNYAAQTLAALKSAPVTGRASFPSATTVLRQTLAAAADGSMTIITIGGQSNIALLMQSPADQYSELSGADLWSKKVARMYAMNSPYPGPPRQWDYNSHCDAAATAYVYQNNGGVPIIGNQMPLTINIGGCYDGTGVGCTTATMSATNPLRLATDFYIGHSGGFSKGGGNAGRPAWDPSTILLAMVGTNPAPGGAWFNLSGNGTLTVSGSGYNQRNVWSTENQSSHYYVTLPRLYTDYGAILNSLLNGYSPAEAHQPQRAKP
jgi:inosine-uridine nucleoside N-ribohydrolase